MSFLLYMDGMAFNPGLLSPTAWYDFTSSAYLTLSSTAITQALDRSGSGNDTSVQGTSTARPTWTASQINGLSAAVFDGGDTLQLPSALISALQGNNTIFYVAKTTLTTTTQRVIAFNKDSVSFRILAGYGSAGNQVIYGSNPTATTIGNTSATTSNFNIVTQFRNGTTQSLSVNNGTAVTDANGANVTDAVDGYIGSSSATDRFLTGTIAEIIIYNRALSTAEIVQVNKYLSFKYAITIS